MDNLVENQNKISPAPHYALLAIWGLAYNQLIERLEENNESDMMTGLAVVLGVSMTLLLSIPILGRRNISKLFISFAASGAPMVVGHLQRWQHRGTYLYEYRTGKEEGPGGQNPPKTRR